MLLPSVGRCVSRLLGTPSTFFLAQAVSGHRCFTAYFHRFEREMAPNCDYCDTGHDDVKHMIFSCPFWAEILTRITTLLSRGQSLDSIKGSTIRFVTWTTTTHGLGTSGGYFQKCIYGYGDGDPFVLGGCGEGSAGGGQAYRSGSKEHTTYENTKINSNRFFHCVKK